MSLHQAWKYGGNMCHGITTDPSWEHFSYITTKQQQPRVNFPKHLCLSLPEYLLYIYVLIFKRKVMISPWQQQQQVSEWEWRRRKKLCFFLLHFLKKRNKIVKAEQPSGWREGRWTGPKFTHTWNKISWMSWYVCTNMIPPGFISTQNCPKKHWRIAERRQANATH